jgi:hypothetical protein
MEKQVFTLNDQGNNRIRKHVVYDGGTISNVGDMNVSLLTESFQDLSSTPSLKKDPMSAWCK